MHSTSDRMALRYVRREGRECQLKTLGVPVPLALRCIPQVTEGHCGMHGERGGKFTFILRTKLSTVSRHYSEISPPKVVFPSPRKCDFGGPRRGLKKPRVRPREQWGGPVDPWRRLKNLESAHVKNGEVPVDHSREVSFSHRRPSPTDWLKFRQRFYLTEEGCKFFFFFFFRYRSVATLQPQARNYTP